MTPSFVNDPAVSRDLGEAREEEVRAAVQSEGDCATCRGRLGAGPLRLDVRGEPDIRMVHVRHAACAPMPDDSIIWLVGASSYQTNAVHLAQPTSKAKRSFWRPKKAPELRESSILILNPSVDVFAYFADDQTLLDRYRSRGFREPGTVVIGSPDAANDAGLHLSLDGDEITLNDAQGGPYVIGKHATIAADIRQRGGALVALSYRNHAQDVRDMVSLHRLYNDVDGTTEMWVPLTETQGETA